MTDQSNEVLISLRGLSKVFYTEEVATHAISNVHLDILKGEYVAMEGPSGSGKTTLMSIIGLLEAPTCGTYQLGSDAVANLNADERAIVRNRHIGFISQSFNLIGDLDVYENVELPLIYRGMSAGERKQRTETALERVGMMHRGHHMPSQLSGGQQQRVAVARAVAGDPLILLADEPTGNLDSRNGDAVMTLMSELHEQGTTICMVTHNPEYAIQATRTLKMFDGRILGETRTTAVPATSSTSPCPAPAET